MPMASASTNASPPGRDEHLPRSVLISYSAAQFGLSAMNTLVNTQIPFFYVDTLKLPGGALRPHRDAAGQAVGRA